MTKRIYRGSISCHPFFESPNSHVRATPRSSEMIIPALTFFGLLNVTLVMPGTCFSPSFAIDFLAFFSFRECTVTLDPAGMPDSPSPPAASASSESELLEASSTSAPFLAGGSSGSSSMRGFDNLEKGCTKAQLSAEISCDQKPQHSRMLLTVQWSML